MFPGQWNSNYKAITAARQRAMITARMKQLQEVNGRLRNTINKWQQFAAKKFLAQRNSAFRNQFRQGLHNDQGVYGRGWNINYQASHSGTGTNSHTGSNSILTAPGKTTTDSHIKVTQQTGGGMRATVGQQKKPIQPLPRIANKAVKPAKFNGKGRISLNAKANTRLRPLSPPGKQLIKPLKSQPKGRVWANARVNAKASASTSAASSTSSNSGSNTASTHGTRSSSGSNGYGYGGGVGWGNGPGAWGIGYGGGWGGSGGTLPRIGSFPGMTGGFPGIGSFPGMPSGGFGGGQGGPSGGGGGAGGGQGSFAGAKGASKRPLSAPNRPKNPGIQPEKQLTKLYKPNQKPQNVGQKTQSISIKPPAVKPNLLKAYKQKPNAKYLGVHNKAPVAQLPNKNIKTQAKVATRRFMLARRPLYPPVYRLQYFTSRNPRTDLPTNNAWQAMKRRIVSNVIADTLKRYNGFNGYAGK